MEEQGDFMAQQKNFDKAVALYHNLFSLPTSRGLAIAGIGSCLFFTLVVFPLTQHNFILLAAFYLISWIMSTGISFALLKEYETTTIRRTFGLGVITVILHGICWAIPLIVHFFLPLSLIFQGGFLVCLGIISTVRLIVFSSITPARFSRTIIAGASYSFIFLTLSLLGFPTSYPPTLEFCVMGISIQGIFLFIGLAFIWIVNTPAESSLGIGGIKLFQGFAEEWLVGESQILDDCFTEIGSTITTNISLYVFERENKPKCGLVIPEIHPGPFKTVGSSALPLKIREKLGETFTALHGPSTHDLNLVSKEETARVVDIIANSVTKAGFASSTASNSFRVAQGKIKILSQYFGKVGLYIATAAPEEIDDIAQVVGTAALLRAREKGTEHAAFVDAHNCIGHYAESVYLNSPETKDIIDAVGKAANRGKELEQKEMRIGVASETPTEITEEMGLAPGGITTFVVETGEQLTCYVIADSNNAITGLREKIRTRLFNEGFDEAELLTTDTHMASGSLSSQIGFNPLGESGGEAQIIQTIHNLAQKAKADLAKASLNFIRRPLEVNTIGKENLAAITTLIAASAKLAKRLIAILMGLGLIAAFGLYLIIPLLFSLL